MAPWPLRVGIQLMLKPGAPGYRPMTFPVPQQSAMIEPVVRHLPGEAGSLKDRDIVLSIDGRAMNKAAKIVESIAAFPSGLAAEFEVLRDDKPMKLSATPQN